MSYLRFENMAKKRNTVSWAQSEVIICIYNNVIYFSILLLPLIFFTVK